MIGVLARGELCQPLGRHFVLSPSCRDMRQRVEPGHARFDAELLFDRHSSGIIEAAERDADVPLVDLVERQVRPTLCAEAALDDCR